MNFQQTIEKKCFTNLKRKRNLPIYLQDQQDSEQAYQGKLLLQLHKSAESHKKNFFKVAFEKIKKQLFFKHLDTIYILNISIQQLS